MKSKKILVISSSPRRKGNSDAMCDEFVKGALDAGHSAEKIFLGDLKIGYCRGCETCSSLHKPCPQKDDAAKVISAMVSSAAVIMK